MSREKFRFFSTGHSPISFGGLTSPPVFRPPPLHKWRGEIDARVAGVYDMRWGMDARVAGVVDLARGMDARVAGVVDLAMGMDARVAGACGGRVDARRLDVIVREEKRHKKR